jgi:hypothetical protein
MLAAAVIATASRSAILLGQCGSISVRRRNDHKRREEGKTPRPFVARLLKDQLG